MNFLRETLSLARGAIISRMKTTSWKGVAASAAMLGAVTVSCAGLGEGRTDAMARTACPELGGGAMHANFHANAKVNGAVRAFVQASADLRALSIKIENDVIVACKHMAHDL